MKQLNKLFPVLVAFFLLEGCVIPKEAADSLIIKKIRHDPESIREAAGFAIGQTYATDVRFFDASEIADENMRNKISRIGNKITISYDDTLDEIMPDSIVSFSSLTPFGKTEIIYDFALRQRMFPNHTDDRQDHYFIKVTDRIYYRRSLLQ
jgi:hypothetical protein